MTTTSNSYNNLSQFSLSNSINSNLNQSSSNQSNNNSTRILLLKDFNPDLKTGDITSLFRDWEDDRGGFKIKWIDDSSLFIVFADSIAAKQAYLTMLSNLPLSLQPNNEHSPKLEPYSGPDSQHIFQSVQTRPRSRSISSSILGGNSGSGQVGSNHSRKNSLLGSGGGGGVGGGNGIVRYGSLGRRNSGNSFSSESGGNNGRGSVRNTFNQNQSSTGTLIENGVEGGEGESS